MPGNSSPDSVLSRIEYIDLLSIPGITEKEITTLLNQFPAPDQIFNADIKKLTRVGIKPRLARAITGFKRSDDLKRRIDTIIEMGTQILIIGDTLYPNWIRDWTFPPPILFCLGRIKDEDQDSVGIIGTRRSNSYGRMVAEHFSNELARAGLTIVSGLARGVDTVAHRAALKVGGRTVAFLGCGIDIYYPKENQRLYHEIAESGAVFSEFPPGTPPWKKNFIKRNRLIPAFSRAIIAIEAPQKSGVLNTVKWTVEMGKDVMAVPGNIFSPKSKGINQLIKDGAIPVTEPEDVLNLLKIPSLKESLEEVEFSEAEKKVVDHIEAEPKYLDEIALATGLTPARLAPILFSLQIKRIIRQLPGGFYVRTGR